MSDWLVVSVDLRDQALRRRKSRADVFTEVLAEQVEGGVGAGGEEEEEVEEEFEEGPVEGEEEKSAQGSRVGSAGDQGRDGSSLLGNEEEVPIDGAASDPVVKNEITVAGGGISELQGDLSGQVTGTDVPDVPGQSDAEEITADAPQATV